MEGKEAKLSEKFIKEKMFSANQEGDWASAYIPIMHLEDVRTLIEIVKLETRLEETEHEYSIESFQSQLNSIAEKEGIK